MSLPPYKSEMWLFVTSEVGGGTVGLIIMTWFCRRNCKGNPNCLVGIGEQAWLGEIDENAFHNIDDPNSERRDKVFLEQAKHTVLHIVYSLA